MNMPERGWQADTLIALIGVVAEHPGVVEVRVHGSVAKFGASTLDPWADLDVAIVIANQQAADWLFPDPHWLAPLGEVWAFDGACGDDHATLRVILSDLRRLDVALLPESCSLAARPGRVMFTKPHARAGGAAGRTQDGAVVFVFAAPVDDPDPMRALHARFRFDAVLAAVKAARGDVLIGGHLALGLIRHVLVAAMLLRDRDTGGTHHRYGGSRWDSWASGLRRIEWPCTTPQIISCIRMTVEHFTELLTAWDGALPGNDTALYVLLDTADDGPKLVSRDGATDGNGRATGSAGDLDR